MTPISAIDTAAARLLAEPIRHLYALLWRAGLLDTDKEPES
jgi:hypothetical protein